MKTHPKTFPLMMGDLTSDLYMETLFRIWCRRCYFLNGRSSIVFLLSPSSIIDWFWSYRNGQFTLKVPWKSISSEDWYANCKWKWNCHNVEKLFRYDSAGGTKNISTYLNQIFFFVRRWYFPRICHMIAKNNQLLRSSVLLNDFMYELDGLLLNTASMIET